MVKKTLGRRKIEMKKMEKEENIRVTFSRRRSSLFKKANELSVLCGAEVGVLAFSPTGKPYAFGSPNVGAIINRFEGQNGPQTSMGMQHFGANQPNAAMDDLSEKLNQVETNLEKEKKYGEELDKAIKARENKEWWESPIEELNLHQLEQLKTSLQCLRGRVTSQAEEINKMQLQRISTFLMSD